jgi:hypothetical protein
MRRVAQIALAAGLSASLAGPLTAQWGPRGSGLGFGMRSWVLYDGGVDSLAAVVDLSEQQRGELAELAGSFRTENADAIERLNHMRAEIESLWTEEQRPTRLAISRIAEKYDNPARDLRPALNQLHEDMSGILTVQQQRLLLRGRARGFGRPRGIAAPGYWGRGRGGRFGPAPRFSPRAGRGFMGGGRTGRWPDMRQRRWPPLEP